MYEHICACTYIHTLFLEFLYVRIKSLQTKHTKQQNAAKYFSIFDEVWYFDAMFYLQGCPRRCSPQETEAAPGDDTTSSLVEPLCPGPLREASGASTGCW